jgi:hypothetical protein
MKMRRYVMSVAAFCALTLPIFAVADRAVFLVARTDCPIDTMDLLDVRKMYLGFTVRADNNLALRAATNQSDKELFEIFMQDVMAMSARSYDRRLLTLTLQSGRRRPEVYMNVAELQDSLQHDPNLITFMWDDDFQATKNLKVLRVIWRD